MFKSTLLIALALVCSCARSTSYIPGTKIPRTDENHEVIEVVERYRQALERKDVAALLLMASKTYYEDGGTQTGTDDYGYEGLRDVLATRFRVAENIRYSLKYITIERRQKRVFVEVFIDASFSLKDARGQTRREDLRDQNMLVLVQEADAWKFVSGM